ncbi:MAG: ABC transporter permease [Eubacteriales bacterium]|nr:ABC transporter permease [Eubacteriales bacterium]
MQTLLSALCDNGPLLLTGVWETLYMTIASALVGYLIGLPLGVLLMVSARDGIRPRRALHAVLGWAVNIGRSIPFIILIIALIPLSRAVMGTSIGYKAAVVSLVVGAAPFIARLVESSLAEIDRGVVEAARAMGATDWQIITRVLLPEAIPSLVRGVSIATIMLVGYTAMAGTLGGGGLGAIAIRYGYHRYQSQMMIITIVLLVILVQVTQVLFNLLAKAIDKRNR